MCWSRRSKADASVQTTPTTNTLLPLFKGKMACCAARGGATGAAAVRTVLKPQEVDDMIVLKATQDKVLAVLQSVAGIVERRHTLPILANVLIRKTGNALQLTTSDLEIQIRTTADWAATRATSPPPWAHASSSTS